MERAAQSILPAVEARRHGTRSRGHYVDPFDGVDIDLVSPAVKKLRSEQTGWGLYHGKKSVRVQYDCDDVLIATTIRAHLPSTPPTPSEMSLFPNLNPN